MYVEKQDLEFIEVFKVLVDLTVDLKSAALKKSRERYGMKLPEWSYDNYLYIRVPEDIMKNNIEVWNNTRYDNKSWVPDVFSMLRGDWQIIEL